MTAQDSARAKYERWLFRRNLVICLAQRNGASERLLADVFDLSPARVHAIIDEFRREYGATSEGGQSPW